MLKEKIVGFVREVAREVQDQQRVAVIPVSEGSAPKVPGAPDLTPGCPMPPTNVVPMVTSITIIHGQKPAVQDYQSNRSFVEEARAFHLECQRQGHKDAQLNEMGNFAVVTIKGGTWIFQKA